MEKLFDRNEMNLGVVSHGTKADLSVTYLGEEPFLPKKLHTQCSCTNTFYNEVSKVLQFSINFRNKGKFNTVITYNPKPGVTEHITVQAEVE